MNYWAWIVLLLPIPVCVIAGLIAKSRILSAIPDLFSALAPRLLSSAFSSDKIGTIISDPASLEKIRPEIEQHLDHFLGEKLAKEMPVIGMFVGEKTIHQLKQLFMKELDIIFPTVMGRYFNEITTNLSSEKMNEFISVENLRLPVNQLLSKPLNRIPVMTGMLGAIISMLQLVLVNIAR
ncbi:MAG TPA: hypothetical protein VK618_12340 [Flavitalea sp.]|nr:hypothetical protein [Flavitalea sp.]